MCYVDLDDGERWDHYSDEPRVARKQHTCDGCGALIVPGAHYLRHFHVFDGKAESEKACFCCWAAGLVFLEHHGVEYAPSYLQEALHECMIDDERGSIWRALLAGLLRRWRVSADGRRQLHQKWSVVQP